jgi:hypothetical protein
VGLGPSTVVRLEGALTHEVLRYCTAIRGSVLKVVRGTGWNESTDATGQLIRGAKSPTAFETLIGHNRKPATTTSCVRHGHAKTALNTGSVQGTGASGARSNSCGLPDAGPPNPAKTAYGGAQGYPCQATRRLASDSVSMNTKIWTFVRRPVRPNTQQVSRPTHDVHSICTICG